MRLVVLLALAAAAVLGGAPAPAAGQEPLAVTAAGAGAPLVEVGPVLAEPALREAARSGLPLRLRFRLELWRDAFFDDLVRQAEWMAVVAFEPLGGTWVAGTDSLLAYDSYESARAALEGEYRPELAPSRSGRYYYLAFLEIETLSTSDLDELGRWLRGELGPAVRGGRSVTGAVGAGLKRALIRVLDLPTRRYEARSPAFRVP